MRGVGEIERQRLAESGSARVAEGTGSEAVRSGAADPTERADEMTRWGVRRVALAGWLLRGLAALGVTEHHLNVVGTAMIKYLSLFILKVIAHPDGGILALSRKHFQVSSMWLAALAWPWQVERSGWAWSRPMEKQLGEKALWSKALDAVRKRTHAAPSRPRVPHGRRNSASPEISRAARLGRHILRRSRFLKSLGWGLGCRACASWRGLTGRSNYFAAIRRCGPCAVSLSNQASVQIKGFLFAHPGKKAPLALGTSTLLALGMLALSAPAEAQETTLVSNTGETVSSSTYNVGNASGKIATQGFHTGDHSAGYSLHSVGIDLGQNSFSGSETLTLSIYSSNANGTANALVHTLTTPGSSGSEISTEGIVYFTAASGASLDADTDYHVVIHGSGNTQSDATIELTQPDGQTGEANWTIENAYRRYGASDNPDSFRIAIRGRATGAANNAPTVANALPDQTATAGAAFSYAFPANTFSDADTTDTLTYTATKGDGTALSTTWLTFTADTRTFSGMPTAADVGTLMVKVTASDGNGGSVFDTFDIVVSATTNNAPVFADATLTRSIAENTAAGQNVGAVIPEATDADSGATLTYTMEGTDAGSFDFDAATRQIATKAALDFETKSSYSVTIKVSDGTASDTVAVTITVTDENERPAALPQAIPNLVSNLGQLSALDSGAGIYAQGFRTGANPAGYTVTDVLVRLAEGSVTSATKTSVLIKKDNNGLPGELVTALTSQAPLVEGNNLVEGINTFAAPANTTLDPETNYFISVNEATPGCRVVEDPDSYGNYILLCSGEGTPVYHRAVYQDTGRREGLWLAGKGEKLREAVCRFGARVPIHGVWLERRANAAVRTRPGRSGILATRASRNLGGRTTA